MAGGGGVLERELLGAASARARFQQQQRQRGEEANLILQLGTVVTSTSSLADHVIDSPPNSDPGLQGLAAAAATVQRSHVPRTITEIRKSEDHLETTKYRSNNHILPYQRVLQFVLQDHNYGAPPPPTPPLSPAPMVQSSSRSMMHHNHHHHGGMHLPPPPLTAQDLCGMAALATVADQVRAGSTSLSLLLQAEEDSRGSPLSSDEHDDPGLEGEETETAAEGEGDEDSVTRCICDFEHDDGYMICCDKCFVWQHVDCMGIDRSNIPDEYMCELCKPRRVDRTRARNLQLRKQMHNDTSSSDDDQPVPPRLTAAAAAQARRLSAGAGNPRKRQAKRETKKVVKRQRRDSAAVAAREQRVSERRANKKKEMLASSMGAVPISPSKTESKRIGTRRRSKNKQQQQQQADSLDEDTQEAWAGSNHSGSGGHQSPGAAPAPVCAPQQPQQLRQWIDNYEEAVTNHYSPELRARISSVKVNGVHSDFKVSNYTSQKCRTTMQENGLKVLIATTALHANQPIIEIRGKYMLAAQQQQARGGGPGRGAAAAAASSPYLLFYTLPKEGTEVCVDARTYGNDARFVRSSCKPNAEVRHCIEKGALHLYLVASQGVERLSEITIKHEETGPRSHCKDCPPQSAHPTGPTQRNGMLQDPADRRVERRRRGSRRTTSSEDGLSAAAAVSVTATVTPAPPPPAPVPVVVAAAAAVAATPSVPEPAPSPPVDTKPATPPVTTPTTPVTTPPAPTQAPTTPVTRRGPKSPIKVAPTTPVTPAPPSLASEDSNDGMSVHEDMPTSPDKRKMTREERKMEAIMKAFERLEKAEQRRQETLARQKQRGSLDSQLDDDSEHHDTDTVIRRPKGRRTRGRSSSGASSYTASADEGSAQRQLSPAPNTSVSPRVLASPPPASTQPITIDKQASVVLTNCLSFKFPKTKKVLMNEWLSKPSTETPVSPVKLEVCDDVVGRTGAAAAKKRWLRQAISEESEPVQCSSPNRASSPPGGDYVTPLKKRRLARESLSSEQSFTPPTTPASDKEEARSPDLEEAPAVTSTTPAGPVKEESGPAPGVASQIHNAARCVEEAVKVLTSDSSFLEQIMGQKVKCEGKEEETVQEKTEDIKVKKEVEEVNEERPPSPPVLQRPCTPPPPPTTIPAPLPPPLPVVDMKEVLTPASIKRKLSISEYRQRKKAEGSDKGGEGCDGASTPSPTSQDDERDRSAAGSPADPQLDGADKPDGPVPGNMRWSSEPTLVERQRENLTERLKREFGLFLDDQEANKMAALANTVLGTVASKQQQQEGTASVTGAVAAAISTATPVGMVASAATVAGVPNNCALLPPLPPLEPPSVKCADPHNIPLPPCSPPPLHDLLSEPALPPSPTPEDAHSKSAKQPAASCNGPTKLSPSKSLSGAVQSKNQILSSPPQLTNSTAKLTNKKSKKPIPTSTPSLQNNAIRQASSTATTT